MLTADVACILFNTKHMMAAGDRFFLKGNIAVQALQETAAAEAERKANSSKARVELEEQMKEKQILQRQQQVCVAISQLCHAHLCSTGFCCCGSICLCGIFAGNRVLVL